MVAPAFSTRCDGPATSAVRAERGRGVGLHVCQLGKGHIQARAPWKLRGPGLVRGGGTVSMAVLRVRTLLVLDDGILPAWDVGGYRHS